MTTLRVTKLLAMTKSKKRYRVLFDDKQASGDILPDLLEGVGAGSWFCFVDPLLLRLQYAVAKDCRKVSITIQLSQ
jgi:hypothetical protein